MRKHTALQKIAVLLSALCLLMGVVPAQAATTNEVAVQSAALASMWMSAGLPVYTQLVTSTSAPAAA